MNEEWSNLNKAFQIQLRKEETFEEGIKTLLKLRQSLMNVVLSLRDNLSREGFNAMPFPNAKGYHCKTIAYSIWHIFRIEDIVANDLIRSEIEVFQKYEGRIHSPIITTGNELVGQEIVEFSKHLDLEALYNYAIDVKESTDALLEELSYQDLKRKFTGVDEDRLRKLIVVSSSENASWLIPYWCGKDIRGLLQMPFSRHWIMHIEASLRIKSKFKEPYR